MSTGFKRLTKEEVSLLNTFDEYGELVLPDLFPNGNKILKSLIKQDIVINTQPYKLSKRGLRIAAQINSHQI